MTQASPRAIQRFEVSLKAFIVRDGRVLLLREADTGWWELPGGRIDVGEEMVDHAAILAREIAEELGAQYRVAWRPETASWTVHRVALGVYQFLQVRHGRWVAGDITLSAEHDAVRWTTPADWAAMALPPNSGYAPGLARLWTITSPSSA